MAGAASCVALLNKCCRFTQTQSTCLRKALNLFLYTLCFHNGIFNDWVVGITVYMILARLPKKLSQALAAVLLNVKAAS